MTLEPLSALLPAVVAQLAHHNPGRTPMTPYYDRQGNLVSLEDWCLADQDVASTTVGDCRVSTVFLGLDRGWGDGPPQIFETMVFGGQLDEECVRYSTEAQALAGHDQMVGRVRGTES